MLRSGQMNYFQKFEKIIQKMNVPRNRMTANSVNASWFIREGAVNNKEHPDILTAIFLARKIM